MNEPKKSLGQHWLNDEKILSEIVDLAEVSARDTILEIGPGQGSLTKKLIEKAGQVVAVEKDEELAKKLSSSLQPTNLKIIEGDILKFDLTGLPPDYKVVANIPYYLTNNLLRILCESTNPPKIMVLLVQKEVAERVAAAPGKMSLLSFSVQFYCNVSLGPVVSSRYFMPPPKVDSQILKLTYREKALFENTLPKEFFRVVKAGFANRRKTLLNSLSSGLHLPKDQTSAILKQAGIKENTRAQELSLNQWHKLYSLVK